MWWSTVGVMVTLTCSLLAAPLLAEAQPVHVPRVGVLAVEGGMVATSERFQAEFRAALRERGYVEGQTILVDYRWVAAGQTERLNDLAVELVRLQVDLMVALNTPAAQAAKRATPAIPIVFNAGDPVGTGLVASLARPGGNVTGISGIAAELGGKCLDLLRELLPTVTRVAALVHATDPFARPFLEHIQSAARSDGVSIQPVVVRGDEEFDGAFTAMVQAGAGAVIIHPILATPRAAALAVQHHLPTIAPSEPFAEAGGLMTYAANHAGRWRSLATYVDKILKGTKPADLPVERPMKFDLVINLKTAQVLGLTIPPALLFQAEKVIPIKGVHIAKTPTLSVEDRMKIWKSHRGGHGISMLIKVVARVSSDEENLLKRLEEYAFWADRYPIPVNTNQYVKSIKPQNLRSLTMQDPALCDTLFERLAAMIRTTTS